MSDFKNCLITTGTSNLRFKNCLTRVVLLPIDTYSSLIDVYGAILTSITYIGHDGVEKNAFQQNNPTPVVGTANFYTDVEEQLADLCFIPAATHVYNNYTAQIKYYKVKFLVISPSGNIPVELLFEENGCEEFDLSQIDSVSNTQIIAGFFYNGTYIATDLNNIPVDCNISNSIDVLDTLIGRHYITSYHQDNAPLVNVADPKVTFINSLGQLKGLVIYEVRPGGGINITEIYVSAETFYNLPSAKINFELEIDCSDLTKIKLTDTTGVYDSDTNITGYGTPNYPSLADIVKTEVKLYDGSNVLLGTNPDLGYIPSFNPQTFTFLQAIDFTIGQAWRKNKEYRLEYILHLADGNTLSCGQKIFIIDGCGGADDPYQQLEDCIISKLKKLFEKDCADNCSKTSNKEIDRLLKMKNKFEVLKASLNQNSDCVVEDEIDKLLKECQAGCIGC